MKREPFHACKADVHGEYGCICPAPVGATGAPGSVQGAVERAMNGMPHLCMCESAEAGWRPCPPGLCELPDHEARVDRLISLQGCARCHGDGHENLRFRPLRHPVEVDCDNCPAQYTCPDCQPLTHWSMCPTTGEPILLAIVQRPDASDTPFTAPRIVPIG